MFRFILVSTLLVAAASAQYQSQGGYNRDPKTAAILSEQRYLSGDGKFGAAYDQEDGTNFKEETDADGNRRGSYSYLDPSGQRRTISYVAGKNGSSGRSYDNQGYDDGQYDPRWNDPSFSQQHSPRQSAPAPAPVHQPAPVQHNYHHQPAPAPAPVAPQYNHYNNAPAAPRQPAPQEWTTQAPHRFQPPGKLQLNRTPDGFSYTFNKV
ncbi:hypothetical protein pipiens_011460 [Culex pipiens pipiens]|uniref:Cuticular protein n=1 Tax=Culex pipiens pipiens TaxID=38569 RepID=A0ABD1D7P6_CULPP